MTKEVEDRSVEELLNRLKKSAKDIKEGRTSNIKEMKI